MKELNTMSEKLRKNNNSNAIPFKKIDELQELNKKISELEKYNNEIKKENEKFISDCNEKDNKINKYKQEIQNLNIQFDNLKAD